MTVGLMPGVASVSPWSPVLTTLNLGFGIQSPTSLDIFLSQPSIPTLDEVALPQGQIGHIKSASGLWTSPPTINLPQTTFIPLELNPANSEVESQTPHETLSQKLNFAQARDFLTHQVPHLEDDHKTHYTRFVSDRMESLLGLMHLFVIPEAVENLQGALEFFADQFANKQLVESRLEQMGLRAKDADPETILENDQMTMMQWVHHEAAGFLFDLRYKIDKANGQIGAIANGFDPHRLPRKLNYRLEGLSNLRKTHKGALNKEGLLRIYEEALKQRIVGQYLLQSTNFNDDKKAHFYIGEGGFEVNGHVAAQALTDALGPGRILFSGYYRSGSLINGLLEAQGYKDFHLDNVRQFLTRITDPRSGGVDMGSHAYYPEYGIERVISALGMNMAFASGGSLRERLSNPDNPKIGYTEVGDATVSTNEFHHFMETVSTLNLPVIVNIVDNNVGISVRAEEGRGTRDFEALARSRGFEFISVDGNDVVAVYRAQFKAAKLAQAGKRVMIWNQNLPRLNSHSSSSGRGYRVGELDPLVELGQALVKLGFLKPSDVLSLKDQIVSSSPAFFEAFNLGTLGDKLKKEIIKNIFEKVYPEPLTQKSDVVGRTFPPLPQIAEPRQVDRLTQIPMNVALRAALIRIMEEIPLSLLMGQDAAEPKGGIFQVTKGLSHLFPGRVLNSLINEDGLLSLLAGFAMRPGTLGIVEMPYDDYALNTLHRLYQMGLFHWLGQGQHAPHVIMRVPTEPVPSGAIYHTQSSINFYASLPGMVIVSPSTSSDAYGLLLSLAQYLGPSILLEPKILYRGIVGPALSGERVYTPEEIRAMKAGWTPPDLRGDPIPLGKAAIRKSVGDKGALTIASWGSAVGMALEAAQTLDRSGLPTEVIDLRTLVPWDRETVMESVGRTGALLVAGNGPTQAGLGEHIAFAAVKYFQSAEHNWGARLGRDLLFDNIGWDDGVPALPQHPILNQGLSLNPDRIVAKALEMYRRAGHEIRP